MKKYTLSSPEFRSHIDYEADLNSQQYAVVTAGDGPILVVAGAGSGKTRTLTYRVAHLVDRGVSPAGIVLCTFTNKAAREMLARVEHLVEGNVRQVWGGTFHHLANRLLREHCSKLGYEESYIILDQEDSRELMAACIAEKEKDGLKRLLPRAAVLADQVSFASNTQAPLDQVILKRAPTLIPILDDILDIARAYRDRKRANQAMDFDDLLTNLKELLSQHPQAAREISERFRHVLVDEYQDTNSLQCDIVDLLAAAHKNLSVVGDDAQSIYGFRGANPDNMLGFRERWPSAQVYKLETNYRSTPQILNVANRSIQHNRNQLEKQLSATRPPGTLPGLVSVKDTDMQAAFVAQRVMELAGEGIGLGDMAVLYRAHSHSLQLQVELTRRSIPYVVRSGVRFFEQAHIKDVLAHLRLLENPLDELSWLRVLKLQPGIGRTTALRIWEQTRREPEPLDFIVRRYPSAKLPSRGRSGFKQLQQLLAEMTREEVRSRASLAIGSLLEHGYRKLLPNLYLNPESREEDIEQLAAYSDHYEDLRTFLSELNLLSGFSTEEVLGGTRPEDALVLSTVHQAKGLEWKIVFVLSLNEGFFPHPWALNEADGGEEERRLFYVALTRTMDELYLVTPLVADRSRQRRVLMKPSRFVTEIDVEDMLERWDVEES
jgi:DNA helicase-2/ATP-dependent DNA helicase PcrA